MNSMVSWYQRKIGAYDLQIWERAVELQEQQDGGMQSLDKRSSSVRPDLIDIDLIRGSTFSKNKPHYSWLAVTCLALIRIIFLPLFYKWWIQQSSKGITILVIFLYFLHGVATFIYINGEDEDFKCVPPSEVMLPLLVMSVLGSVHCHVVSTNFRPFSRKDSHRNPQKRTLSSALLEPVASASHQTTLSFITSSVKGAKDYGVIKPKSELNSLLKTKLSVEDFEKKSRNGVPTSEETGVEESEQQVVIGRQRRSTLVKQDTEKEEEAKNSCKENTMDDAKIPTITETYVMNNEDNANASNWEETKNKCEDVNSKILPKFSKESSKCKRRTRSDRLWDEMHSTSSGSDSSSLSGESDYETTNSEMSSASGHEDEKPKNFSATALLPCSSHGVDRISVKIWENNQCKKVQASLLDIGSIIRRKVQKAPLTVDIFVLGIFFSFLIAYVPTLFRIFNHQHVKNSKPVQSSGITGFFQGLMENVIAIVADILLIVHGENTNISTIFVIYAVTLERFISSMLFFFMLCAAQRTFSQRFLFAKYFSHLTSSRRAKKSDVPHFRLDKVSNSNCKLSGDIFDHEVENVRLWLSLRSYLRRRGPQRSVDVIVSSAFFLSLCLLCFISIQLLHDTDLYISSLLYWEMTVWLLALAIFLLNFMTLGAKINKKYNNISVLLTEQINLYLQMKHKPHKKEELHRANSVLSLAVKLIKEIETPFNIYGLAMNPLLYNITRVVVLSAFSGVISEILGFKLKIWKIKP